ncbi:hypothetical protein RQP54_06410 [Curvibacter sp. APW13]|uniref:hypothetical protein n=1 Tax=Curvibacter sp. APW13 TaxID=3077236 RepID=UPI0028E05D70|nr:hypothetical protein [Curvibacter sp. APW13]MDT8990496.1 hypothetical protein [Curvibacter sp. APW13]
MSKNTAFAFQLGATVAATLFFVASVAFATIPWNLGQHPGEPHQAQAGHMT